VRTRASQAKDKDTGVLESDLLRITVNHLWYGRGMRRLFMARLAWFMSCLAVFVAFCVNMAGEEDGQETTSASSALGLTSTALFGVNFVFEAGSAVLQRRVDIWCGLSMASSALVAATWVLYELALNEWLARSFASGAAVVAVANMLYFMRGFDYTGSLVNIIVENLMDMAPFLVLVGIIMFGVSISFYLQMVSWGSAAERARAARTAARLGDGTADADGAPRSGTFSADQKS
jgi:hypothetical protein